MARPMTTFIRKLVDFTIAKKAYLFGMLPNFTTLLALIIIGAAVAATTALLASTASILSALAMTVGIAVVNFWFSREIQSAMLGLTPTSAYQMSDGKEVEQDWVYDIGLKKGKLHEKGADIGKEKKVNYNLAKAVDHLRGVINARYPDEVPLPPIRLGTFAEHHYKLVVTGRNPGKAMIALANPGVFHTFKGKPREFNALMLQALAQIKLRSTFSGMMVGVLMDFGLLLQSFKTNEFLPLKMLGHIVAPFGQLLVNAMSRTNVYYRADRIVAECGYGEDLMRALDLLSQPNNIARVNTHRSKPAPLPEPTGRFASFVRWGRKMNEALRADSYPGEDETGYALLQFIDNLVLRFAFFFKELFSATPRAGHRKEEIKAFLAAYEQEHGHKPAMQLPEAKVDYKYCNVKTLEEKLKKYAKAHDHAHHHHSETPDLPPVSTPVVDNGSVNPEQQDLPPAAPEVISAPTPVLMLSQPTQAQAAEPAAATPAEVRRSPRLNTPPAEASPLRRSPRLNPPPAEVSPLRRSPRLNPSSPKP